MTPDEWLLRQYDTGIRPEYSVYPRHLYDVIEDHQDAACVHPAVNHPGTTNDCRHWSGAARWPTPIDGDQLVTGRDSREIPRTLRIRQAAREDSGMTRLVIGLTGRAGSGKDAVGSVLVERYGFARVAFADALKRAALDADPYVSTLAHHEDGYGSYARLSQVVDAYGWEAAKVDFPDVRRFLQRFGVAMRDAYPGIWVAIAQNAIRAHRTVGTPVAVTDVRFADEVDAIRLVRGGMVARLHRGGRALGGNASHVSEQVDALDVDVDVDNSLEGPGIAADRIYELATERAAA